MSRFYLTALLSAFTLVACSDLQDLGDPAFVGVIQSVSTEGDRFRFGVRIFEPGRFSEFVDVGVLDNTVILVERPGKLPRRGQRGDLAVGTTVRVWHERWIRGPAGAPQVGAVRIEILQQEADQ